MVQGLRSIAAVIIGFGFMAATVMVGSIMATLLFLPGGTAAAAAGTVPAAVPPMYLAANLALGGVGALFGGWLAARIGSTAPMTHAAALAALTAGLAIVSASQPAAGPQPAWYAAVVGAIGVVGVLAGGKLRAAAAADADAGGGVVA